MLRNRNERRFDDLNECPTCITSISHNDEEELGYQTVYFQCTHFGLKYIFMESNKHYE